MKTIPVIPPEKTTVEWVLCSSHFSDFVLIAQERLNDTPINSNYQEHSIK